MFEKGRVSPAIEQCPVYVAKTDDVGERGAHLVAYNLLLKDKVGGVGGSSSAPSAAATAQPAAKSATETASATPAAAAAAPAAPASSSAPGTNVISLFWPLF